MIVYYASPRVPSSPPLPARPPGARGKTNRGSVSLNPEPGEGQRFVSTTLHRAAARFTPPVEHTGTKGVAARAEERGPGANREERSELVKTSPIGPVLHEHEPAKLEDSRS